MSNNPPIKASGIVEDVSGGGRFKVRVDLGGGIEKVFSCYQSGKMRMHKIIIIAGDRVQVEIPHPYELGRIVFRLER